MNDETINNIEKEKEDNIFKYSPFPIMNINPQGKVIKKLKTNFNSISLPLIQSKTFYQKFIQLL